MRWFGRRRRRYEEELQARARARRWQRECYYWQRQHPGVPVMEAMVTHEGSVVVWNGPVP